MRKILAVMMLSTVLLAGCTLGGVTCTSGADSVTCVADSGRGFTLSRSAYNIS